MNEMIFDIFPAIAPGTKVKGVKVGVGAYTGTVVDGHRYRNDQANAEYHILLDGTGETIFLTTVGGRSTIEVIAENSAITQHSAEIEKAPEILIRKTKGGWYGAPSCDRLPKRLPLIRRAP